MMDDLFHDMLDEGVVIYLDDILIYAENMADHQRLVKEVLRRLDKAGLSINAKKSQWHASKIEFLGYIISAEGITMSPEKVQAVKEWPTPRKVKNVQEFLGFANFYRRFIDNFARIAQPLTELTKNNTPWVWNRRRQEAFNELKRRFCEAPVLDHFHSEKDTILETDASDYAYGSVLSQLQEDTTKQKTRTHPVAYLSKQFNPAEINYDIHDKEMLAIVRSFHAWETLLKSCQKQITVWTDHKNLEYFNSTKSLTRRQARWAEFLSEFDFIVNYRPGEKNGKPDALSRREDHRPKEGSEAQPIQYLFKPGQLRLEMEQLWQPGQMRIATLRITTLRNQFKEDLLEAGLRDPQWVATREAAAQKKMPIDPNLTVENELLLYKNQWYIPNDSIIKRRILHDNHDSKLAGHFGIFKTLERLKQNYHWPKMAEEV